MSTSSDSYDLGIDLGTTYVAAAVVRDVRAEIVTLGDRFAVIPSVLFIKEDGTVLTGDPAVRRGMSEPARVVREFKRRVGDSAPIVVGQTPYSADALLAELLRFVYTEVTGRQGARPRSVVITHPANWGSYKIDVLGQAVRMADIGDVEMLTEPAAAAVHFAAAERLEVGQSVAVYDLGGGTFDAAVLRKAPDGFELLGEAEGIERLGGIDFDEAVFQHVVQSCESSLEELDPEDPTTTQALARLRQDCVSAKETLSTDTDVTIPVVLPGVQTQVRLTRAEFEAAIRPLLVRTVEALRRVIRTSGLDPQDLAAVLLAGGSSRIPLIAELVMADLGRPIAVDLHPKHTVALGAAIAAHQASEPSYQSAPPEYPAAADHAALTDATMTWQFPLAAEERFPLAAEAQSPLVADEPAAMPRDDNGSARPDAEQRPEPLEDRYERGEEDLEDEYSDEDWFVPSAAATRGDDNDPDAQRPARVRAVSAGLVALAVVFGVGLGARSMLGNGNDANGVEQQGASPEAAEGQAIADITAINLDGDRYTVAFDADFEPALSDDPADHHLHFFFDTVPLTEAGKPGAGPWKDYDGPSPFTGYGTADRPQESNRLCITVATHDHRVKDPSVYQCLELPTPEQPTVQAPPRAKPPAQERPAAEGATQERPAQERPGRTAAGKPSKSETPAKAPADPKPSASETSPPPKPTPEPTPTQEPKPTGSKTGPTTSPGPGTDQSEVDGQGTTQGNTDSEDTGQTVSTPQ